jgi:hypothetical protein
MKVLLTVLLMLSANIIHSQQINDTISLNQSAKPIVYLYENYYEVVYESDSLTTIFNVSYLNDIVFGIDYIYSDIIELKRALKQLIIDAVPIGFNMYLTSDNRLIVIQNTDLIMIRDATTLRSERIRAVNEEEQSQAENVP